MDSKTISQPRKRSVSTAFSPSNAGSKDTKGAYDVESETPPSEPFYSPAFQNTLGKGQGIADKIGSGLDKAQLSPVDGDDLPGLIHDAKALSKFEASDTRIIAILGDSGEGKYASH